MKDNIKRVFLVVLDSFGIGEAPDAEAFGDGIGGTPVVACQQYDLRAELAEVRKSIAAAAAYHVGNADHTKQLFVFCEEQRCFTVFGKSVCHVKEGGDIHAQLFHQSAVAAGDAVTLQRCADASACGGGEVFGRDEGNVAAICLLYHSKG